MGEDFYGNGSTGLRRFSFIPSLPKPFVAFSGRIVCLRYFSLDPSNQTTFPGALSLGREIWRRTPSAWALSTVGSGIAL